jgi:hypothetical protein
LAVAEQPKRQMGRVMMVLLHLLLALTQLEAEAVVLYPITGVLVALVVEEVQTLAVRCIQLELVMLVVIPL